MTAKVKLIENPTPTAQLVKGVAPVEVRDSNGRSIKLQKPGILAVYNIMEVMGDQSANPGYSAMVLPLIYVVQIGDEPNYQPVNKLQLNALIERLGDEGVEAVMQGVMANWGKQDPEAEKVALKK